MIISISAGVDLGNDFLEDINYISADNGNGIEGTIKGLLALLSFLAITYNSNPLEFNKVEIPIELTKNININISDTTDEIIRWSFVKHEREFIELLGASVPKLYEKVFSIVSVSFDCENGKLKTI
ncbi:MAG: hypothetical protein WBO31_07280, partial [Saprospiraceae bacterium]